MKRDYITYDEYRKICVLANINDEESQTVLLDFLHDLGVVMHFKDLNLLDTHVLDPRWITEGVYRIINSKELAENKGILNLQYIRNILKSRDSSDRRFPRSTLPYIINLMKKFELCYEIDSSSILIPQLLDVQKPVVQFNYYTSLKFVIEYDFLPKAVIPQFIVSMHRDIKDELRWRTGVFLEDTVYNCQAVVEADEREKKIKVNVQGEQRRDYFSVIRYRLLAINNSFEKIRAIEKVPMPDKSEISVSYEHLLRLEKLGEKTYIPDGSDKRYYIKDLLGTIHAESRNEEEVMKILKKLMESSGDHETWQKKLNDIIQLQPNFFGFGVNINQLLKKINNKF